MAAYFYASLKLVATPFKKDLKSPYTATTFFPYTSPNSMISDLSDEATNNSNLSPFKITLVFNSLKFYLCKN